MNPRLQKIIGIGICVVLFSFLIMGIKKNKTYKDQKVTTHSKKATGLTQLLRGLDEAVPYQRLGKSILKLEQLENFSTLVIASPTRGITGHEAEIILDWVFLGGELIVSSHNEATSGHLTNLFQSGWSTNKDTTPPRQHQMTPKSQAKEGTETKSIDPSEDQSFEAITIPPSIKWPGFENKKITVVTSQIDNLIFKKNYTYGFYSQNIFEQGGCNNLNIVVDCFFYRNEFGQGHVNYILGIPPFSNAMVLSGSNTELTASLFKNSTNILFDEFHHFFQSKTFQDLLKLPAFIIPISSMVFTLFLFFIFGPHHQTEPTVVDKVRHNHYHDVNINLITPEIMYDHSESNLYISDFLIRKFPEKQIEIETIEHETIRNGESDLLFSRLIQLHKNYLKQLGRDAPS